MRRPASRHQELPAGQTTRLYFRVQELKDQTIAGKDISSSSWSTRFRLFKRPPGAEADLIVQATGTKTTNPDGSDGAVSAGSTGWVYFDVKPAITVALGEAHGQLVLVDTGTADAATISDCREFPVEDVLIYQVVSTPTP